MDQLIFELGTRAIYILGVYCIVDRICAAVEKCGMYKAYGMYTSGAAAANNSIFKMFDSMLKKPKAADSKKDGE